MPQMYSLSVHDESLSEANMLLNLDLFSSTTFTTGDIIQITAAGDTGDVQTETLLSKDSDENSKKATGSKRNKKIHPLDSPQLTDERFDVTKGYFFIVENIPSDLATKMHGVQVGCPIVQRKWCT